MVFLLQIFRIFRKCFLIGRQIIIEFIVFGVNDPRILIDRPAKGLLKRLFEILQTPFRISLQNSRGILQRSLMVPLLFISPLLIAALSPHKYSFVLHQSLFRQLYPTFGLVGFDTNI